MTEHIIYNVDAIRAQYEYSKNLLRAATAENKSTSTPRRRRPIKATPQHPDIRILYDDYITIGWSLKRYADERLGISRQHVWNYFNNVFHPNSKTRDQIKARTGIEIGSRLRPRRR